MDKNGTEIADLIEQSLRSAGHPVLRLRPDLVVTAHSESELRTPGKRRQYAVGRGPTGLVVGIKTEICYVAPGGAAASLAGLPAGVRIVSVRDKAREDAALEELEDPR